MAAPNPFFASYQTLFRATLKAKGLLANQTVELANSLPNSLNDAQYAQLAALVVACDAKVLPDLVTLVAGLCPNVEETVLAD
jgi:hypothetical protein